MPGHRFRDAAKFVEAKSYSEPSWCSLVLQALQRCTLRQNVGKKSSFDGDSWTTYWQVRRLCCCWAVSPGSTDGSAQPLHAVPCNCCHPEVLGWLPGARQCPAISYAATLHDRHPSRTSVPESHLFLHITGGSV